MERLQQWFQQFKFMTNDQISAAIEYRIESYRTAMNPNVKQAIYEMLKAICVEIDITEMLPILRKI